jgi:hypothetical protein
VRLDHVILASPRGLDAGAEQLRREAGLATVPGGTHPAFGTANRVLPLTEGAYLELASVVDPELARHGAFGRLLTRATAGAQRPVPAAWRVAVDDLDAHAARLGVDPVAGSRTRPDGVELRWRTAGVEAALAAPYLPFLIEWQVPARAHPSAVVTTGPPVRLVEVRLSGDPGQLDDWLDGGLEDATVVVDRGEPTLRAFVLDVGGRTVVLRR